MQMSINQEVYNEGNRVAKFWESQGFLNGIKNQNERNTLAVLLENQKLFNESTTDTGDIAQFKRISIPLVRRIYPQLIANKIVSVQPLLGPTGLVYYMRYRYSSNKGATRGATQPGFPGDDALSLQQRASGDANLDTYYSSSFINAERKDNPGGGTALSYTLEHTPILAGTVTGLIYDGSVLVQQFNINQAGTFTFTTVGSPSVTVSSGAINLVTGQLVLTWSGDPGANTVVVNYQYNMEGNPDMPELNMAVESESIEAITRKLRASWTFEAQQDLRSQHNLDAEQEITNVMAQEINLEIDREILGDLLKNAGTVAAWDFSTSLGDTIKEKYESLYVKLTEISTIVHRKTLRGGANFVVCSPEIAALFETATAGYAPTMSDNFTSSLGIQYVGAVNGKWRLYKDPLFNQRDILMGYKGDNHLDSGYFYCPYVPLTQTPLVYDPHSYVPSKGLSCRYGKKMLREGNKFYARISCNGLFV